MKQTKLGTSQMKIVECLQSADRPLTAGEISLATYIPLTGQWGGVYKILKTLERKGIVKGTQGPRVITWSVVGQLASPLAGARKELK